MKIKMKSVQLSASHLLSNITAEKEYDVVDTYAKQRKIVDDNKKDIWISNTLFKKYFKEI